jgi:hypothetical protein
MSADKLNKFVLEIDNLLSKMLVDYEYDPGFNVKQSTSGMRFSKEWLPGLRLGGTMVKEEKDLNHYELGAVDGGFQLFNKINFL